MRTTKLTLILSLALLAAPALAQERLPERETGAQRAARVYRSAGWPAASGKLAGADLSGVKALGFARLSLQVDPLRASAEARFAQEPPLAEQQELREQQGAPAQAPDAAVLVRVRVLPSVEAARRDLLGTLAATQALLERRGDMPGVAFGDGGRDGATLVIGARGNVRYDVRALGKVDVQPLAVALAGTLTTTPVAKEGWVAAPQVEQCSAESPRAKTPTKLALSFSKAAPQPVEVAFRCSSGAAVLRTKQGYELYAARAGEVTVEVVAASKSLGVSRSVYRFEVGE